LLPAGMRTARLARRKQAGAKRTERHNLPARKADEALGFRPIGSYRLCHLREALQPAVGA